MGDNALSGKALEARRNLLSSNGVGTSINVSQETMRAYVSDNLLTRGEGPLPAAIGISGANTLVFHYF